MSDYSFMKTGFNNNLAEQPTIESQIDIETVEILLTVFINNALKNAYRYSTMCKRNGVSKEDIVYSLKYEVFEFLNQPDLMDKIEEARNEYLEDIASNEAIEDCEEDEESESENAEDILDDDGNSIVVPDDEIDTFERINENILDEETEENKEFVRKIHSYYDNWDNWTPTDTIETVLKNAIDKVDI